MSRLAHRLARFRALGGAGQRTLLMAAAWMPVFWLGLHVLGLTRLRAWVERTRMPDQPRLDIVQAKALGELVNIAAHHTLGPHNCLTRSLLLERMLRHHGVASALRIGVRMAHGELDAHAWVECDGVPVNDQPEVICRFALFDDLVQLKDFRRP